jgi:hypothetical protein
MPSMTPLSTANLRRRKQATREQPSSGTRFDARHVCLASITSRRSLRTFASLPSRLFLSLQLSAENHSPILGF